MNAQLIINEASGKFASNLPQNNGFGWIAGAEYEPPENPSQAPGCILESVSSATERAN